MPNGFLAVKPGEFDAAAKAAKDSGWFNDATLDGLNQYSRKSYDRLEVKYPTLSVSVTTNYYPNCCGLAYLTSPRIEYMNRFPGFGENSVNTWNELVDQLMRSLQLIPGGAGSYVFADRCDGTGHLAKMLLKLPWEKYGFGKPEPLFSANNPLHNSDIGMWLIRGPSGQQRRQKEEML